MLEGIDEGSMKGSMKDRWRDRWGSMKDRWGVEEGLMKGSMKGRWRISEGSMKGRWRIDEGINEGSMKDRWLKSRKQATKENEKTPKKKPYIKNYATPDRPPPAAAMLKSTKVGVLYHSFLASPPAPGWFRKVREAHTIDFHLFSSRLELMARSYDQKTKKVND